MCLHASFISIFLQICQVVVKKVSYRVQSSFRISNNETETATTVMPSFNSVNLKCFPSRKHDEWLIFLQKFRSFLCMRKKPIFTQKAGQKGISFPDEDFGISTLPIYAQWRHFQMGLDTHDLLLIVWTFAILKCRVLEVWNIILQKWLVGREFYILLGVRCAMYINVYS